VAFAVASGAFALAGELGQAGLAEGGGIDGAGGGVGIGEAAGDGRGAEGEAEDLGPEGLVAADAGLLLDVMAGDASRFMRRDAVEASWNWVTNILDGWAQQKLRWLPEYPAGTWGPVEADRMIQRDGRSWRIL